MEGQKKSCRVRRKMKKIRKKRDKDRDREKA